MVACTGFVLSRERLREILIYSEDVCACEPASLYGDSSVLLRVLCGDKCLKARWSSRLIQILSRPTFQQPSVGQAQRRPRSFRVHNSCRPAAVKALGHMAVFDVRTLNGVPELAFARWSHPTLFAPVPNSRGAANDVIPPCCSQTDPRRLRRCRLWCRHRGSTSRIASGAIRSSSDAQARLLRRRSCRHSCRTG